MKKLKQLYIIFVFVCLVFPLNGQDQQFSQFFSTPLYLSPSLTGASDGTRIIINYRNQWPSIPNTFNYYALSADHYFTRYKSGAGILLLKSLEGGVFNTTNAGVTYSYVIQLSNIWRITPGLRFSYFDSFIDWTKLEFGDQLYRNSPSSVEQARNERINYYDFTGSLMAYTENIWFGFTTDHLLSLNKQFTTEPAYPPLFISIHGGIKLMQPSKSILNSDKSYTIAFNYHTQASFHQLDIGAYYEMEHLRFGLWFRGGSDYLNKAGLNAIILLVGYNLKQFKFNYSYDVSTSRLMTHTGGAHEISLMFKLGWEGHQKKLRQRSIPCPDF